MLYNMCLVGALALSYSTRGGNSMQMNGAQALVERGDKNGTSFNHEYHAP